ncbi:MAG TPA: hypothetical protein VJ725_02595 [Thermoanaerobaculia bacterium]|nr:hypothetical protein [Thermoanaerobaculia bacterium]
MRALAAVRAVLLLARFELIDLIRNPAPILMRCLTLPVYVVALTALWNGVHKGSGAADGFPALAYFLLTQTILDACLNRFQISSLMLGFEPALLRPLSWRAQGVAQAFGRTAGQLLVIGALVQGFLALADPAYRPVVALRWLLVLPLLALADALATEVMAGLYVRIGKSDSLRFVITKSLLALGGGLYPLLGEGGSGIGGLRYLPFSDFVFQPAYFCLYGHAYGMATGLWLLRLAGWMILLALAAHASFRLAWSGLQVAGG